MPKVLLIEDDVNLSYMIADGLDSEDFETTNFDNGEEALMLFNTSDYDIVLTDVNLRNKMDGFELAREIRSRSDIPIIFITSRSQAEDLKKGYGIGNVDYLKKPFGITELFLRVNELLSRPRNNEQLYNKKIGKYLFSNQEQCLFFNNEKINLYRSEANILALLLKNINGTVSKSAFVRQNLGEGENESNAMLNEGTLYNLMSSLREKLSKDSNIEIESIRKEGYRLFIKE